MKIVRFFLTATLAFSGLYSIGSFAAPPPAPAIKVGDAAGGDLTGTYPNPTIRAGAVTAAKLADGSVTFSKINAGTASAGQFLSTDGAGNLGWASAPGIHALYAVHTGQVTTVTTTTTEIVSIEDVPAGTYMIQAKVNLSATARTIVDCTLGDLDGTIFDQGSLDIPDPSFDPFGASGGIVSMLAVETDPNGLVFNCHTNNDNDGDAETAGAVRGKLVAIPVAGVN